MPRLVGVALVSLFLLSSPAWAQDQPPLGDSPENLPPPTPPPGPAADSEPPPPPAPASAGPAAQTDPDSPVVRAQARNIGMYFRFGGLANLTHSNNTRNVGPLLFTQVGMKFVFSESFMLPIWFGTGMRVDNPDQGDSATNWGIDLGVGFEYHFRIWRRISPFVGGSFGFDVQDPTQDDNMSLGVGLGPMLGIEYYVADRVSMTAMYMFTIQIGYQDGPNSVTSFGISTLAGGALNITYYF